MRNAQTQEMQIWEMDSTGVKTKHTRSGAEYKSSRVAIGALQGKTVSVPLSVSMTAASDTGISNSDGITKNRTPVVSGVAMPSATVTLYANNQIVGSTIAASNGQWSVTSQELADGNYDLSVEIRSQQEAILKQVVKRVTIDTAAPTLDVSGVFNGIDWLPSDQVKAQLTDSGSGLLNVTYQVDNQSPIVWTGSNGNWLKSASELLNWNDSQQQGSHKLIVKGTDRAGNEQSQTIEFSVAKPLSWVDTDVWADTPLNPGTPNPNDSFTGPPASGGSGGGSAVYGWGANGYWGYSFGGGWYGSPYNTPQGVMSSPQWFPSNANPTDTSTYRQRLTKILTTAIAAIPSTTDENKAKKAALKNRMNVLIESGVILHGDSGESISYGYEGSTSVGFNAWTDRFFLGSLEKAKSQGVSTVSLGLALAKDIMNGTESVRLQTFQTLVETAIGAAHLATNWFNSDKTLDIQKSVREIAKTYGLLKPQGTALTGAFAWLDQLWDLAESPNLSGTAVRSLLFDKYDNTKGVIGKVIQMMNGLGYDGGDRNDAQLLGMAEGLLRSALKVDSLKTDLQSVEVVQELLQLGYEIVKVNPTTTADNATEVSTWIETILEKGDDRTSAAGLSEFLGGVTTRTERIKTLQFAQRLVNVAAAVNNTNIRQDLLKSDVLSELVNLGGAYISLNPDVTTAEPNGRTDPGDFLDTVYRENNLVEAKIELQDFLSNFNLTSSKLTVLSFQRKVFQVLREISPYKNKLRDIRLNSAISVLSGHYSAIFEPAGKNLQTSGLLGNIWRTRNIQEVNTLVTAAKKFIGNPTTITEQSIVDILLDRNMTSINLPIVPIPSPNPNPNPNPIPNPNPNPNPIDNSLVWQGSPNQWPSLPQNFQFSSNIVANKKALIVSPYEQTKSLSWSSLPETKREADTIEATLKASQFKVDRLSDFKVENLLNPSYALSGYGVIVFSSHGIGSTLLTNEQVAVEKILTYRKLLFDTTLVVRDGDFAITPEFIKKYSGSGNSNSIVYLGACDSFSDNSLATAFHSIGAGAVFGYDKIVGDVWAADHGIALFNALSTGRTVSQLPFIGDIEPANSSAQFNDSIKFPSRNLALRSR